MDCQLQEIQQRSKDNLEPRSINHVISVAFKEKLKVNFQDKVEVRLYGRIDPLTEPGTAPLGKNLFQHDSFLEFPTSRVIQNYPGCFKKPLDEEIFAQLSWIANIGTRSRETIKQRRNTLSVSGYHEELAYNKKNPIPTPIQCKHDPYCPLQKILLKWIILDYSPGAPHHGLLNA